MVPTCSSRYLVVNGVPRPGGAPPVSTVLESIPGAYTTTRTHANATLLLFWDRHLRRLADSARIVLADSRPDLLGPSDPRPFAGPAAIRPLVHDSLRAGLGLALGRLGGARQEQGEVREEELAVTTLVGNGTDGRLDVYVHLGFYLPPSFGEDGGGARLAVAGRGREAARAKAKYSEWVRVRKGMEKMRPPLVTELLLSNDGDRILEGSLTNFFVVFRKVISGNLNEQSFEVQTAPTNDAVLPGVIRQLVIEICSSCGIPLREVAPSWSDHEFWEEAFVTSSLRLVQHVETIQAPVSCENLHQKSWEDVSWVMKRFEGAGIITSKIQKEIMARAGAEGCQLSGIL